MICTGNVLGMVISYNWLLVPRPPRSAGAGDYWIRVCLSVCLSVRLSVNNFYSAEQSSSREKCACRTWSKITIFQILELHACGGLSQSHWHTCLVLLFAKSGLSAPTTTRFQRKVTKNLSIEQIDAIVTIPIMCIDFTLISNAYSKSNKQM